MMVIFTLTAFLITSSKDRGFIAIHKALLKESPKRLSRPGAGSGLVPGVWIHGALVFCRPDVSSA